ncbi:sensor histidine kinase [Flagellimonas okinawensis]|uniref:histidine kinase n=1 Tax=Flagellimonas okinawensis TaxID=3031324 RepID=A0ABT5XU17_9FLAO|nr:sensor histidine kinase [[Muricauda] okinawensis]MDF0709046.1 ATP-binding protein [[Muricauda] okinawensis]
MKKGIGVEPVPKALFLTAYPLINIMENLDFRFLTTLVFTAIFGVFGVYHLFSYLILRHKILLHYCILIFGLTMHWSLSFFIDGSFGESLALFADKASLTTAMITTYGLLIFTKDYLNIEGSRYPRLSKGYRFLIIATVGLPLLHLANNLLTGSDVFNDMVVMIAAIIAMAAIFLNIFSGFWLFTAQRFNRYYLYSYAPILLAALFYIGTWFLMRFYTFNAIPVVLTTSVLITFQLILFSLLLGFKYKLIEDENMRIQIEANRNLISEVDRQTKELQITNSALEMQNEELARVNELKNKLFSLLSHDVRAPLNNLSVIISMIEEHLEDDELKGILEKLNIEISDKIDMVNGLLQWSYSQLEGIRLETRRCDIQEMFATLSNEFERIAENKNIAIVHEVSAPEILTDDNILKVVLRNLISNALKFSHKDQKIVLWSRQGEGYIEIGVEDFGTGMDASWFNKLAQGDKPQSTRGTSGEKGTGFGLLIAKDFVEILGGELICESQKNEGTNFMVRFSSEH